MVGNNATLSGWSVVLASWLAVFCLFGYRATFAILKGPMGVSLNWSAAEVTLGYSLMMVWYAGTAYFSGLLLDRWGTRPVYAIAAVFGGLGFVLTARVDAHLAYLFVFGLMGGVATGMLWVTSTVSVRLWYVGRSYATMWGVAFTGAPMAQFVLAQVLKPRLGAAQEALERAVASAVGFDLTGTDPATLSRAIADALTDPAVRGHEAVAAALGHLDQAWRGEMTVLGVIVFVALLVAVMVAKRSPESYGWKPFGTLPDSRGGEARAEYNWTIGAAFSQYAIWAATLTFLTSVMAEFLIWTQVVRYWTDDLGYSLPDATSTYALIGLIGIVGMPVMGQVADRVVKAVGHEARGRKLMLIIGPGTGMVACLFLLAAREVGMTCAACFLFAVYWSIVPGGVVGYTGAVYGRRPLARIWGLATLIAMGIGPFTGSFIGAWLKDWSGSYTYSVYFALAAFGVSTLLAATLPLAARPAVNGAGVRVGDENTANP